MKRDLRLLTDPIFLAGLALLLANDFFLKTHFHNWLTGKLSDFAGLFIFPLFWTVLLPRHKSKIYAATVAGFVFWKSPYSQPLIEAWNSIVRWEVARTVDTSDLVALLCVFVSARYHARFERGPAQPLSLRGARKWATCVVFAIAVFAFAATSFHTDYDYENQQFIFADSREGVLRRLKKITHDPSARGYWSADPAFGDFAVPLRTDYGCGEISARISLKEMDTFRTSLILHKMEHRCSSKEENEKQKMLLSFLHGIIEKLQDDIDAHPTEQNMEKSPRGERRR